jgi:hypothetical protein
MGIGDPPDQDFRAETDIKADARPLRIIELRAENVKRIKAVRIRPDGSIVSITGPNDAGKSSVLDAIAYAIGGKALQPAEPVRRGADKAQVLLDLGDLHVKRTWSARGGTYLTVTSPNGAEYPSPQKVLDRMLGKLTFDPVAFSRMAPADQVATLKDVAGVGELFDKLDTKRDEAYQQRTIINRDVKALTNQIAGMPEVDAPDQEVALADLTAQHEGVTDQLRQNDQVRQLAVALDQEQSRMREHFKQLGGEHTNALEQQDRLIQQIEDSLYDARFERNTAQDRHADVAQQFQTRLNELGGQVAEAEQAVATLVDPDLAAIATELQGAEATNAKVRQNQARAAKMAELRTCDDQSTSLTQQIEHIDDKKRWALAEAKLPVEGLGFGEVGVTLKGFPFEQASSAEQLRVSVAMGIALNPRLRVMLIHDGSLLDTKGRQLLADMAEKHDMQVWVESVSEGDGVGVVIEDGEVVGAAAVEQT